MSVQDSGCHDWPLCVTMSPFRSVASSSRRTGALGGGRNREPMAAFLMALAIGPCARSPQSPSNVSVGGHNTSPCLWVQSMQALSFVNLIVVLSRSNLISDLI